MLERILNSPGFYGLLLLLTPLIIYLGDVPFIGFGSQLESLYTILITVLIFSAFLLFEELLSIQIKIARQRRLLTLLLLFVAPVPAALFHQGTQQSVEFLLLLCLIPAFLTGIIRTFFQKRGSLFLCSPPAILIALIEPIFIPFLILATVVTYRWDKEKSYFLFASFTLPPLFLRIHSWESSLGFFSESFSKSQAALQLTPFPAFLDQVLHQGFYFFQVPELVILFIILWSTLVWGTKSPEGISSLRLATLLSLPICCFLAAGKMTPSIEGGLCIMSLSLLMLSFSALKDWFESTLDYTRKALCILGLFCLIHPLYLRAVKHSGSTSQFHEHTPP